MSLQLSPCYNHTRSPHLFHTLFSKTILNCVFYCALQGMSIKQICVYSFKNSFHLFQINLYNIKLLQIKLLQQYPFPTVSSFCYLSRSFSFLQFMRIRMGQRLRGGPHILPSSFFFFYKSQSVLRKWHTPSFVHIQCT